jgi:glycosyltransferase involved in cell wall biosynthesis
MTDKPSITAIILSFNEEVHIARCIERLWPVVQRIVVIDSFSTDRTVEIARSLGAEVLQNVFRNHAAQFQWGVDHAQVTTDWTIRIDCDEYLEDGLIDAIVSQVPSLSQDVTACTFKLKVIFRGKFIRWGGCYRTILTRLWRTGVGHIEQRWMDERIVTTHGVHHRLQGGDLVDENLKDITWWTDKHNSYATKHMIDFISLEQPLFPVDARIQADVNGTAKWKRFLRNIVYGGAPLYLRAVLYFFQRYFLRLGFLDGRNGFAWHFLQGFWLFVLMDAKVDEARQFIDEHGLDAFKQHLVERFGIVELVPIVSDTVSADMAETD